MAAAATVLGSMVGLGGGVIIEPVLDAVGIQGLILAALLIPVYFREKFPSWNIKNMILTAVTRSFLGSTASFLGIGEGR